MLHPAISYQLAHARIADLRRFAQRDTTARAARGLGRPGRPGLSAWVPRRIGAVPGPVQGGQPGQPAVAGDIPAY